MLIIYFKLNLEELKIYDSVGFFMLRRSDNSYTLLHGDKVGMTRHIHSLLCRLLNAGHRKDKNMMKCVKKEVF